MAKLGEVISTAITGGDSPVFQGAAEVRREVQKATKKTDAEVAELQAKVDKLTTVLEKLAANTETSEEGEELTPQQRAAKTRAANKAK